MSGITITRENAERMIKAHQYLYYVLATPVWSDLKYDSFCKEHGIEGGGGSDMASSYSPETVKLADKLLKPK